MIILALDASTTAVGWAVFEDGELYNSGVYVPSPKLDWWVRVSWFGTWLKESLDRNPYISTIAYELATGHHGNVHTDRLLGAVEYEARRIAHACTRDFITVTASQVRATECHKENLANAVGVKGGAPLDKKHPRDEADAIGVGLAAIKKLTMQRLESLAKETG